MVATFKISFYENWQGACMTGSVDRFVRDIEEAQTMRDSYEKHYKKAYGSNTIVTYTIND